jgi:3',5'-cyclic AMP phosphodiesterase CpdA
VPAGFVDELGVTVRNDAAMVIAHLSDLHLGAHLPAATASVAADVAAQEPMLTVVTGDCTMRAHIPEFRAARQLLDRLPKPLVVVTGNHDVPLISAARVCRPYARFRHWIEADLDPVVRLPGLVALGLQTTPRWRWKSGRVSRRQSDAVATVLGAAPGGAIRLLAMHHPPRAAALARIAGRDRLLQALADARVDLVLAGHTHVPASCRLELPGTSHGLIQVVAGTATSLRTRGAGRSWTAIRVDDTSVCVEERRQMSTGWSTDRWTCYPRTR